MGKIIKIDRLSIDLFKLKLNLTETPVEFHLTKQQIEMLIKEALSSLNPLGYELPNNKDKINE